jgi:hypothetical protein
MEKMCGALQERAVLQKLHFVHQTGSAKNPASPCVLMNLMSLHILHTETFFGKCTADCKPPKTSNSLANTLNKADAVNALKLYPNPNKDSLLFS